MIIKLFKRKPRRRHRVAHRTAHRWKPCEIGGIVEKLRSENVSDDDVVEKAGGGLARVRRVSVEALALRLCARVSTPSVGLEDIAEGVVCATLCVEASEKALGDQKEPPFVTSSFFTIRGHSN